MPTIKFNANAIGREAGYAFVSPVTFDLLPGTGQYTNEQVEAVILCLPQLIEQKVIEIEDYEPKKTEIEEPLKEETSVIPKTSTTKVAKSV